MQAEPPNYRRKWYVMAAIAMGVFLATIDGSIVNIALPVLARELQADFAVVQWIVLAYLLTIVTLMLSIGRLADIWGKKPLYIAGLVIFTLGSALCGLAGTVALLIAFRVLQAVGAVMTMASSTAIVTEAFPPAERGKALGIVGLMVSIGLISGPSLGGIILDTLSWHWLFWVNLPVGLLGTYLALRYIPAHRPGGKARFDFPGAVSLFVSLLALLLALTIGQQDGFINGPVIGLAAGWLVFLISFVLIELRTPQPLIDLRLFENKLFSLNLVTGFMTFVASAGLVLLMPFFLENILGYDPFQAGLLMATVSLASGCVTPLAGSLSDRIGTRLLTVIGLGILTASYLGMSLLNETVTPAAYLLLCIPLGVGMGVFQSPNNSAVMGAAPPERLGVASGLLALTRTLGQTAGISVIGALWAARVVAIAGAEWRGNTLAAPAAAQVAALQTAALCLAGVTGLALVLSLGARWREKINIAPQPSPEL